MREVVLQRAVVGVVHFHTLIAIATDSCFLRQSHCRELKWSEHCGGYLVETRRGVLTMHRGVLAIHRGALTMHRGVLAIHIVHRGALTMHRGVMAIHRGALTMHSGKGSHTAP